MQHMSSQSTVPSPRVRALEYAVHRGQWFYMGWITNEREAYAQH
jgi:hypothetical protein